MGHPDYKTEDWWASLPSYNLDDPFTEKPTSLPSYDLDDPFTEKPTSLPSYNLEDGRLVGFSVNGSSRLKNNDNKSSQVV
jgi:hypothetical protein